MKKRLFLLSTCLLFIYSNSLANTESILKKTSINYSVINTKNIVNETSAYIDKGEIKYPKTKIVEYPKYGLELGIGWNSLEEKKTFAQCIEFKRSKSGGQEAKVSVSRVDDKDSLRREMNVNYSATAKASFKIASGEVSSKVSFINKSEVENHAVNLLVKGNIVNGVSFTSPSLDSNVITLNKLGKEKLKENKFKEYCGDSFVYAIERGAELYALYNFSTLKAKTNKQKSVSLSASGKYLGFSGNMSYNKKNLLETTRELKVSSLKYFHTAHRGLTLPHDEASVYTSLKYLGNALKAEDSYPFKVHIMSYNNLPIPELKSIYMSSPLVNEVRESYRMRIKGLIEKLDHVIKNKGEYDLKLRTEIVTTFNNGKEETKVVSKDAEFYKVLQDKMYKELVKVEDELKECYIGNENENNQQKLKKCLANVDTKEYSDYFFRTQMPIHQLFKRDKTLEEISEEDNFKNYIAKLQKQRDDHYVKTYRKCKKCGFICGGPCGYNYIRQTCRQHPGNSKCKEYDYKIKVAELKAKNFTKLKDTVINADSRFLYWIDEVSRKRRENNEVNGYLSNEELQVLQNEIYCQYAEIKKSMKDKLECPNIQEKLIDEQSLKFVKLFKPSLKKERDYAAISALMNEALLINKNLVLIIDKIKNHFQIKTNPKDTVLPKMTSILKIIDKDIKISKLFPTFEELQSSIDPNFVKNILTEKEFFEYQNYSKVVSEINSEIINRENEIKSILNNLDKDMNNKFKKETSFKEISFKPKEFKAYAESLFPNDKKNNKIGEYTRIDPIVNIEDDFEVMISEY